MNTSLVLTLGPPFHVVSGVKISEVVGQLGIDDVAHLAIFWTSLAADDLCSD
jgi:hypothetical protein